MKLLNKLPFFFFALMLLFISCDKRKKTLEEITVLRNNLDSVIRISAQLAPEYKTQTSELILAYTDFANAYPDDSLAPEFLFEAARLRLFMQDYPVALQILNTISEKYPDDETAPSAISTAAGVCEILMDCDKAAEYLTHLKEKYPEHPTAINIDMQIEYVCDPAGYLNAVTGKVNGEDSLLMDMSNDPIQ